jgi:mono/diheme cytochrome c family protein
MPRVIVYVLVLIALLALIPPVLFARARSTPSPRRPVHLFLDMDFQPKFKTQTANPLFADGRAMRPPVPGAVARGEVFDDAHFHEGVVDGEWADSFPGRVAIDLAFLERGRERYNIYCAVCHGYAGFGDGIVNQRALELMANADGPVDGTSWVQARNLHLAEVVEQPLGQIFHSISKGVRNMAGYESQIRTEDRWAIVAYVKALQRSQDAEGRMAAGELRAEATP